MQGFINYFFFQIGLPREHASALCKVYSDNLSQITKVLKSGSLQINRLHNVGISKENGGEYEINLNYTNTLENSEENKFKITKEQIQLLIAGMLNIFHF